MTTLIPRARILMVIMLSAPFARAQSASAISSQPTTLQPRIVHLTISPAMLPERALSQLLSVDVLEQLPGNAAQGLYTAALVFATHAEDDTAKVDKWLQLPYDQWQIADVKRLVENYDSAFTELRTACRHEYCAWDTPLRIEGVATLLPELGQLRKLNRILCLRIGMEIGDGRLDRALEDLQTGLTAARYVGTGGTLIQRLVGISMARNLLAMAELWTGRAGSPNLYFAFAYVPLPFVQGDFSLIERGFMYFDLPVLKELDRRVLSPAELDAIVNRIVYWMSVSGDTKIEKNTQPEAIRELIERGSPEAKPYLKSRKTGAPLDAMSIQQINLLYALVRIESLSDKMFRWMCFSYPQAAARVEAASQEFKALKHTLDDGYPFSAFLAGVGKAFPQLHQIDRDLNALQVIEAIRMYAAEHQALPASLDQITQVPIPANPFTGKAFQYELSNGQAVLTVTAPGQPVDKETRYELVLRK